MNAISCFPATEPSARLSPALRALPLPSNAVKLRDFMLPFEADCYASVRE